MICFRAETERSEWMKERDEKVESLSGKVRELKTSLKERNRAVEELERKLAEQTTALETSRSRVEETEAAVADMQSKVTELRRTVAERDEQLHSLRDELTAVCSSSSINQSENFYSGPIDTARTTKKSHWGKSGEVSK